MPAADLPAADVLDLSLRRRRAARAVQEVADAPVRYLPAALLEALQGSWGTPEELLGTSSAAEHLTATAT